MLLSVILRISCPVNCFVLYCIWTVCFKCYIMIEAGLCQIFWIQTNLAQKCSLITFQFNISLFPNLPVPICGKQVFTSFAFQNIRAEIVNTFCSQRVTKIPTESICSTCPTPSNVLNNITNCTLSSSTDKSNNFSTKLYQHMSSVPWMSSNDRKVHQICLF